MPSFTNMPLSAKAKAVTLWLLGAAGLPTSLNTYGAFFAGVAAGTLFSPGLFRLIQHHSYNPSRIQLAVFHVIRLFEQRHNYTTIHQDPHKLMAEMEKEVLFMVDRHISATEAGHVMTQLKRSYGVVDIQEKPTKRVRQVNSQERSQLGYPRGFMAEKESLQVPKETLAALAVSKITSVLMPAENPDAKEAECGCKNMPGGYQNPRSPPRSSNAPSPEPVVLPRPAPNRVPRHQPEKGSFGLDYESKDLYPSDDPDSSPSSPAVSSDSDSDIDALPDPLPCPPNRPATYRRSGHPNVVHKVQGLWRVGTTLSPIAGSLATTEGVKATDVRPPPTANVVKPSSRRLPQSSPPLPPVARLLKKGRGRHRAQDVLVEPPKEAKEKEEKKKPPEAPHNPKWMRRPGFTITR